MSFLCIHSKTEFLHTLLFCSYCSCLHVCVSSLTLALPPLFPCVCVLTHTGLSLPSSHVCVSLLTLGSPSCGFSLTLVSPFPLPVCVCPHSHWALPPFFPCVYVLTHTGLSLVWVFTHTGLSLPSSHVCVSSLTLGSPSLLPMCVCPYSHWALPRVGLHSHWSLPPLFPWCVSSLTLALPPLFTRLYIQCHSHVIRELQKWYRAVFLLLFSKVPLVGGV